MSWPLPAGTKCHRRAPTVGRGDPPSRNRKRQNLIWSNRPCGALTALVPHPTISLGSAGASSRLRDAGVDACVPPWIDAEQSCTASGNTIHPGRLTSRGYQAVGTTAILLRRRWHGHCGDQQQDTSDQERAAAPFSEPSMVGHTSIPARSARQSVRCLSAPDVPQEPMSGLGFRPWTACPACSRTR